MLDLVCRLFSLFLGKILFCSFNRKLSILFIKKWMNVAIEFDSTQQKRGVEVDLK